ncbi:MAG: hypothetical protein ACOY31_01835 [Bacillota bacterium]
MSLSGGNILLASAAAAALAMVLNRFIGRLGWPGVAVYGPFCEEWIKSGSAIIFGVSVPGTHIIFGLLEAAGDCLWGGRMRFWAALFGVAAHTLFGMVTFLLLGSGYPVYLAVSGAVVAHMAWNIAVLRLSALKRTTRG